MLLTPTFAWDCGDAWDVRYEETSTSTGRRDDQPVDEHYTATAHWRMTLRCGPFGTSVQASHYTFDGLDGLPTPHDRFGVLLRAAPPSLTLTPEPAGRVGTAIHDADRALQSIPILPVERRVERTEWAGMARAFVKENAAVWWELLVGGWAGLPLAEGTVVPFTPPHDDGTLERSGERRLHGTVPCPDASAAACARLTLQTRLTPAAVERWRRASNLGHGGVELVNRRDDVDVELITELTGLRPHRLTVTRSVHAALLEWTAATSITRVETRAWSFTASPR